MKARQPNTDPNATTTSKKCTQCKETKLLIDYPFNYKKNISETHSKYRSHCNECRKKELKNQYEKRKQLRKSLTIKFDADDHPEVKDGALIKIEKVDANSEK